jgi:NAD(P)H-hydrate epimerase
MAEVDRLATGPYGIELLQMMELAGRALSRVTQHDLPSRDETVTVVAGGGGNGGGAMVAARRLRGFGISVQLVLDRPGDRFRGAAAHQLAALRGIGVLPLSDPPSDPGGVVVDGLIGYGLTDAPTGRAAELIEWITRSSSTVVSLDVPSGVDASTGNTPGVSVRADTTLTLAMPKSGLMGLPAAGRLLLADIAVPPALWREHFDFDVEGLFAEGDIVELTRASSDQ